MREHDYEPTWGLPGRLPAGEQVLWQGAPEWRALARYAFHIRLVTAYIGGLWLLYTVKALAAGDVGWAALLGIAEYLGMTLAAVGLVALFAWLIARTTAYTVTNRRVVLRYGIALSKTINLPFGMIDAANLRPASGDLAIQLRPGQRVAYLVLWPHARPWKLARAQPMLRAIPDAAQVAQIVGRALAASSDQAAQPVRLPSGSVAGAGQAVPA